LTVNEVSIAAKSKRFDCGGWANEVDLSVFRPTSLSVGDPNCGTEKRHHHPHYEHYR